MYVTRLLMHNANYHEVCTDLTGFPLEQLSRVDLRTSDVHLSTEEIMCDRL